MTPADLPRAERTLCERWTRVMGYHRPVSAFNPGKQSEHAERRYFEERRAETHGQVAGRALSGPRYGEG